MASLGMLSIELFQLVAGSRQLVAVDNAHICVMCLEFLEVVVLQMDDLIAFLTDVTQTNAPKQSLVDIQ